MNDLESIRAYLKRVLHRGGTPKVYKDCASLCDEVERHRSRWDYIKTDPDGARALLLLLKKGKGTPDEFDTMVDRIIESRCRSAKEVRDE